MASAAGGGASPPLSHAGPLINARDGPGGRLREMGSLDPPEQASSLHRARPDPSQPKTERRASGTRVNVHFPRV